VRKQKIYLETTMFNYFFETDRGDMHLSTVALFNEIKAGKYEAYTSLYVTDELEEADEPKRSEMFALIEKYKISVLPASDEAQGLADVYTKEAVIPIKYRYDGLHIACATVNDLDYILSFNFKHINRVKTKTMTSVINAREGYKPIIISLPMEVIENEDE
jgi:hypothetical protein